MYRGSSAVASVRLLVMSDGWNNPEKQKMKKDITCQLQSKMMYLVFATFAKVGFVCVIFHCYCNICEGRAVKSMPSVPQAKT